MYGKKIPNRDQLLSIRYNNMSATYTTAVGKRRRKRSRAAHAFREWIRADRGWMTAHCCCVIIIIIIITTIIMRGRRSDIRRRGAHVCARARPDRFGSIDRFSAAASCSSRPIRLRIRRRRRRRQQKPQSHFHSMRWFMKKQFLKQRSHEALVYCLYRRCPVVVVLGGSPRHVNQSSLVRRTGPKCARETAAAKLVLPARRLAQLNHRRRRAQRRTVYIIRVCDDNQLLLLLYCCSYYSCCCVRVILFV